MPRARCLQRAWGTAEVAVESTVTIEPLMSKDALLVKRRVYDTARPLFLSHEITATTGELLKEMVDEYRQDRRVANAL